MPDADVPRPLAAVLCQALLRLGVLGALLCLAYVGWLEWTRPEDPTRSEILALAARGRIGILLAYGMGFLAFLGWWGRRRLLGKRYHNAEGLIWAIVIVGLLTLAIDSNHNYFYDPRSSSIEIIRQTTYLGIFALGAAVVIIAGGIDLSSGSMIAFSATICACLMTVLAPEAMRAAGDLPWYVGPAAIGGTLFVGFLVGTLHAWLITSIGLPPFIATLATLVGLRSLGRALIEFTTQEVFGSKTTQIQIYDPEFRYLATSIWIPLVIFFAIGIGLWLLLAYTVVGRHLYALGGNEQAAKLSGIRTDSVKWLAYCIGTLTASIAGILYMCDQSVADPQTLGVGYELRAIASAVVGGCSLQGGAGTVVGTILGALFLRTVIDGVAKIIKTGSDVYEGLIVGVVVVFAVAFSQFGVASAQRRQYFPGLRGVFAIFAVVFFAGMIAMVAQGLAAGAVVAGLAIIALGSLKGVQAARAA
ncbi:MAG TPA: ABC transporter permease [Pirellulaceae bacterium]|jgi:ribose/xylose/arabinose/galactoside ABC-type transport system permease subunit|nr:ABC transporter permease [Pirellulaceae bacterium]